MAVNKVEVGGEVKLDLTQDTVTPETLLSGVTAHNAAGERLTGTAFPNLDKAILMDTLYSPLPLLNTTWSFAYGNERFVAINYGVTALYSDDGLSWLRSDNGIINNSSGDAVCFSNGAFFAVDPFAKKLYRSETGESWSLVSENCPIRNFLCANSPVLIGNENKSNNANVLYSEDGTVWGTLPIATNALVAYGNGKYIALNGVRGNTVQGWRSSDGKTWTSFTLAPSGFTNISYYGICSATANSLLPGMHLRPCLQMAYPGSLTIQNSAMLIVRSSGMGSFIASLVRPKRTRLKRDLDGQSIPQFRSIRYIVRSLGQIGFYYRHHPTHL